MYSIDISKVTAIHFNKQDVIRVWFNGEIVWDKFRSGVYLRASHTNILLSEENDYKANVDIESNTNWTFND